jgi:2-polyprenyl-3-methyl-5-hydroxy-6-metoxy-1,4-benzoquinol methylase
MHIEYSMMEWTDENVKKFWDFESQFPENYFTLTFGKAIIDHLNKFFLNASSVLDYGSGPGFLIPHLIRLDCDVYALDFSSESVAKINRTYKSNQHFKGAYTLDRLAEIKRRFDVVTVVEVLEHLNERYLEETINTVKRLLSPDGVAIFTTPNDEDLSKSMVLCPQANLVFHRWQHVRSWTDKTLREYLTVHGLRVLEVSALDFGKPPESRISLKKKIKRILKNKLGIKEPVVKKPHLVAIAQL